jgi:gas vesicle protein
MRRKRMRKKARKIRNKRNIGKILTGMLLGSVIGAAVGWLTAPTSGEELRRRLTGDIQSAREKAKTAAENVESRARDLAAEVDEKAREGRGAAARRRKASLAES